MKPSQLQRLLAVAFKNRLKVLIKGAPGIGKTDIVLVAAAAAGAQVILMHPAVSDPVDFKGLPAIVDGKAEFLPYGQLRKLVEADRLTVCFIDDIGQSAHATQAALMQLLLAREVDGVRISDHVVFCGATNDNAHMAGVQSILEPVKSRWHTIVELIPDHQEWVHWAIARNLPEEVIAFAMFRGIEAVHNFKATRELTNSPSPRTVTAAAQLYAAGIRSHTVIAGACGEGWAAEFLAFAKIFASIPNPEECIKHPATAPVPASTDASTLYAIAVALSLRATTGNFEAITTYLKRLPKEHEVLAVRDAIARKKDLTDTNAFVAWASANTAVLA
jgi:MoxR-like ATPase